MKERMKHLILFIILIAIDQISKYWVRTDLINRDSLPIIPDVLKLQYHTNTGAVWGIMGGKVEFLRIFTLIVLVLILFFYTKIPREKRFKPLSIIIVFILAGAVGNLIDRFVLGHVVDFIYFELINFPLFNFADICLTVSSILLFILAIFYYKDEDFAFLDQMFRRKKKEAVTKEDNSDEIKEVVEEDFEIIEVKKSEVNLEEAKLKDTEDDIEEIEAKETDVDSKETE
ncbi:MAG: signal peptidase II [Mobilitalea sp.]